MNLLYEGYSDWREREREKDKERERQIERERERERRTNSVSPTPLPPSTVLFIVRRPPLTVIGSEHDTPNPLPINDTGPEVTVTVCFDQK